MEGKIRPVLRYPGSKWNIAGELAALIPEHHSYVEPYLGSGALLFTKEPSDIETVNDLDSDVVNLFRCIRGDCEKLAAAVAATPYSREEYDAQFAVRKQEPGDVPDYGKAAGFLVRSWMGHGSRMDGSKVGWRNDVTGRERAYALRNWYRLPEWIMEAAERLRRVQIEHRPALEVVRRFNRPDVFMYIDPPYLFGVRSGGRKQYRHEMTDGEHAELLEALAGSSAKIMVSGYESGMYNRALEGWKKASFGSCAEHGKPRTETVWMNYSTGQISLYDIDGGIT